MKHILLNFWDTLVDSLSSKSKFKVQIMTFSLSIQQPNQSN